MAAVGFLFQNLFSLKTCPTSYKSKMFSSMSLNTFPSFYPLFVLHKGLTSVRVLYHKPSIMLLSFPYVAVRDDGLFYANFVTTTTSILIFLSKMRSDICTLSIKSELFALPFPSVARRGASSARVL